MGEHQQTRRRLRVDERALLDVLVNECGPRLLAYVRRVYGYQFDAEEIVAETFCRAAANIETLKHCERSDLYLLTIARNLCRDHFRKPPEQNMPYQSFNRPAKADEPLESIVHQERRNVLIAAVDNLSETQREVVALRLATDLKFEEIAGLLDVPLGTVLSRMHSAVGRLKQQLRYSHER